MLKTVLTHEQCAKCRICCSFVKADVWEAPQHTRDKLNKGSFKSDEEILLCPSLDEKKGCTLGDNKPFDCKIWPLRPFIIDGALKIGVAGVCPAFDENTDYKLRELLEGGLYDTIADMIKKDSSLVKNHTEGYRIIF